MKKKRIVLPLLLILALALALGGCATDNGNVDPDSKTPPIEGPAIDTDEENPDDLIPDEDEILDEDISDEGTSNVTGDKIKYEDIKLSPSEAFDKYLEKHPDTKIKEIELEKNNDSYVYKVKGYDSKKRYKLYIDPVDGSIIKEREENDTTNQGEISKANTEKIQKLVDKALGEAGKDHVLDEWTVEMENGILELKVEIDLQNGEDLEYRYNLETGELLEKDS